MPLTISDCKGIPALRRERIEAAVMATGRHRSDLFEGRSIHRFIVLCRPWSGEASTNSLNR
jgi:hypothetical protein